jgi:putative phosphoesterase
LRIGVLADTHIPSRSNLLPEVLLRAFEGVDLILHAGDILTPDVLTSLGSIARTVAVAGNNDPTDLALKLGTHKELLLSGYRIGLTHGHVGDGKSTLERALSHFQGADCVVFGHSHIPYREWHSGTLAFNPGSPTDRRLSPRKSFGFIYIEREGLRAEHRFI